MPALTLFFFIYIIVFSAMENTSLSQAYLETLTTQELIQLGDKFGVDIPPSLNRRLIIGELLEIQDDFYAALPLDFDEDEDDNAKKKAASVKSYNETAVNILLRNPGWVFVFWDFNKIEFSACVSKHSFESFGLRVSFFDDATLTKSRDSYNVIISPYDRKWYIHVPERHCFCRVDLVVLSSSDRNFVLAQSNALCIPPAAKLEISKTESISPILSLSGIKDLRRKYWRNHRQSFS